MPPEMLKRLRFLLCGILLDLFGLGLFHFGGLGCFGLLYCFVSSRDTNSFVFRVHSYECGVLAPPEAHCKELYQNVVAPH